MTMDDDPRVLEKMAYTVREAAKVTGISYSKLYRLADAGQLEMKRVGGRAYVLRTELLRLFEQAPSREEAKVGGARG
ncbi:MAG TPA: helix-turn-helix domain-containing protein [Xanthobacteraceae bacterium]|nr:helix-turn-helix domain-containing protein [Xanthobacteraceae bacterium]